MFLVIALEAPRVSVAAGALLFLVGAVIGLMAQLRSDARRDEAVEDFGLTKIRLYQTILASGLAAVAGVVLMAIAVDASGAAGADQTSLGAIFNIQQSPGQLLIAAVFGLSPQLLFDRLEVTADRYKKQLAATEVSSEADSTRASSE